MPSRQRHRGQHAKDAQLFHVDKWPLLNNAVADQSYLLSRGYADHGSIKLVGDRYRLHQRQRKAVLRASCSDGARRHRLSTHLKKEQLSDQAVLIDGYNLLITIEAGMAGGIVMHCRDSSYRDMASVHGTYRKVDETLPALRLIGESLQQLRVSRAKWFLDAPVSNSGNLKKVIMKLAEEARFPWEVELVNNPDRVLAAAPKACIISSDSWILDAVSHWFNLQQYILQQLPTTNLLPLKGLDH